MSAAAAMPSAVSLSRISPTRMMSGSMAEVAAQRALERQADLAGSSASG